MSEVQDFCWKCGRHKKEWTAQDEGPCNCSMPVYMVAAHSPHSETSITSCIFLVNEIGDNFYKFLGTVGIRTKVEAWLANQTNFVFIHEKLNDNKATEWSFVITKLGKYWLHFEHPYLCRSKPYQNPVKWESHPRPLNH